MTDKRKLIVQLTDAERELLTDLLEAVANSSGDDNYPLDGWRIKRRAQLLATAILGKLGPLL